MALFAGPLIFLLQRVQSEVTEKSSKMRVKSPMDSGIWRLLATPMSGFSGVVGAEAQWNGRKGKWVRMWGLQVLVTLGGSFAVKERELWFILQGKCRAQS